MCEQAVSQGWWASTLLMWSRRRRRGVLPPNPAATEGPRPPSETGGVQVHQVVAVMSRAAAWERNLSRRYGKQTNSNVRSLLFFHFRIILNNDAAITDGEHSIRFSFVCLCYMYSRRNSWFCSNNHWPWWRCNGGMAAAGGRPCAGCSAVCAGSSPSTEGERPSAGTRRPRSPCWPEPSWTAATLAPSHRSPPPTETRTQEEGAQLLTAQEKTLGSLLQQCKLRYVCDAEPV